MKSFVLFALMILLVFVTAALGSFLMLMVAFGHLSAWWLLAYAPFFSVFPLAYDWLENRI